MIFPSNRVRIMVATKPVDFRKGHDGLAALVKNELHRDPFTGTVFVFRSRKADRLKLIYWDGSGLVMAYKRLEEHTFTWPDIRDGLMTLGMPSSRRCLLGSTGGGSAPLRQERQRQSSRCVTMTRFAYSGGDTTRNLIDFPHVGRGRSSRRYCCPEGDVDRVAAS